MAPSDCLGSTARLTVSPDTSSPDTLRTVCHAGAFALAMAAAAPACFHSAMTLLPNTLSLGECSLLTQGLLIAVASAAWALPSTPKFAWAVAQALGLAPAARGQHHVWAAEGSCSADSLLSPFVSLLTASVLGVSAATWVAVSAKHPGFAWSRGGGCCAAAVIGGSAAGAIVGLLAIWTLAVFVPAKPGRVWVMVYWAAVLAAVLPLMRVAATRRAAPQVGRG
jgi:hypothetical protein